MFIKRKKAEPEGLLFDNTALKALIIPLIIEQILVITVGMTASIMVSSLGEAALSGVSLVDMLNLVLINVFSALSTGGAVVASQYIGAQKQNKACQSARQLLLVVAAISLLLMTVILVFRRQALVLFFGSIEQDVMDSALIYFTLSAISYPFLAVYSAACALFRAMGNSKITLQISVIMNVVNIIASAIMIFGMGLGVTGAAFGTLLARVAACVLAVFLLANSESVIYISFRQSWRPDWDMIRRILKIGVPNGLENSFFNLGRVLVLGIVSAFGTVQIAANAVGSSIASIATIPGNALGLAIITVVGQCIGARDLPQATYYIKRLMKLTYVLMSLVCVAVLLLLPLILRMYNLSPETGHLAFILIAIHTTFGIFFWPASFTLPNALRASGDVTFTMTVSVISMVLFRILGSYVLGLWLGWGAVGVWLSMVSDWICRVTCFGLRMLRGSWKKRSLTLLQEA